MMKWAGLTLTVLCIAVSSLASDEKKEDNPSPSPSVQVKPLGVEEFMKNVDRHRGDVRVEGVVSTVSPQKKTLALIDSKEFKECGVVTCAEFTLPVKWAGDMPSVKERIRVQGRVETIDGKLIFVAQDMKKITAGEKK